MKMLCIDTSGKFCSISILLDNNIQESIDSVIPLSHSSELAVNVKKIINKYNIKIVDLDCIVINIGPGSFTGLRIGVSFAKGLCLSNNIPLFPVNAFDIMKNKIDNLKGIFFICIHSHKDYVYGLKYNNGKKDSIPKLIDLNNNFEVPMYIHGLKSGYVYENNIIDVNFTSIELIEFGKEYLISKYEKDLNSIHPIYIDYINVE